MPQKKERAARRSNEQLENDIMSTLEALIMERGVMNIPMMSFIKEAKIDANIFYRHYGTMNVLYDKFVNQYDFRFCDMLNIPNTHELNDRQFCIEALKRLYVELDENSIMQKLLLWELNDNNPTTRKIAAIRERMSLNITEYISEIFCRAHINIHCVVTLFVAGIYYLVLRHRHSSFCTVDFNTDSGRKQLFKAIDMFVNILFNELEKEQRQREMIKKMQKDGISQTKIAYYLGISVRQLKKLNL